MNDKIPSKISRPAASAKTDKRRYDLRTLRETASFTIEELALATNRTPATVRVWIAEGLPLMDDKEPSRIAGWAAKAWLGAKWNDRTSVCSPFELYCFKCAEPHEPAAGSLAIGRRGNSLNATARCDYCGTTTHRGVKPEDAIAMLKHFGGSTEEVDGFYASDTSTRSTPLEGGLEFSPLGPSALATVSATVEPACAKGPNRRATAILPQNADNERIKARYLEFLREAKGQSEPTTRKVEIALLKFEDFFAFQTIEAFDKGMALAFKDHLRTSGLHRTTILSSLKSVQHFLRWLSGEPGYVRRVRQADIEYLNLSTKDRRSLQQPFNRKTPKLEDFVATVGHMPTTDAVERRDQALMAFMGITGVRAGAAVTLRIKHLDPSRRTVRQDPKEVATKFGKYIHTVLLPISDELNEIVLSWHAFLITELGFGPNDPLFPKSVFVQGKTYGPNRRIIVKEFWKDAQLVGRIFGAAFTAASLPVCSPHSTRNMIVSLIYSLGLSIAVAKAWSQGLGHNSAHTTLTSYGRLSSEEQEDLVLNSSGEADKRLMSDAEIEKIITMTLARATKKPSKEDTPGGGDPSA